MCRRVPVRWQTERVQRPVLILRQLDGVLTGIHQLRRTRPLETEEVAGLRVPTRCGDDTVVLLERLGEEGAARAMCPFDDIYRQPTGASPLAEVVERLAAAAPTDRAEIDLQHYRVLQSPWNRWEHLAARGRHWAPILARVALEGCAG